MDKNPIRVLIADSHDLFRQGLSSLLNRQEGIEVVGEASDGAEARALSESSHPDVLLMELYMSASEGLHTVLQIMDEHTAGSVAILTSSEDDNDVLGAVKSGVKGYILKNSSLDELVQAVQALSQGGAYFSSSMFTKVLQEFTHLARRRDLQEAKGIDALTDREKDVLRLVARGATNRDIADELVITENTVKVHLRNILDKLQLRNRQQAAAYAVQEGLISRVVPGTYNGYGIRGNREANRDAVTLKMAPASDDVRAARATLADYKIKLS
ncbi:MAG: response regulator transcription factor [Chloroflexi bacterium]|nr:response regulator transcription factor [Chloroflexota bacterium]